MIILIHIKNFELQSYNLFSITKIFFEIFSIVQNQFPKSLTLGRQTTQNE